MDPGTTVSWEEVAAGQKKYLSKGGRKALFNSTLSSKPTYFMSLFLAPSLSQESWIPGLIWATEIGKTVIEFLMEFDRQAWKLVRWETVTTPTCWGGLGIIDLRMFKGLVGKVVMEIWTKKVSRRQVDSKYKVLQILGRQRLHILLVVCAKGSSKDVNHLLLNCSAASISYWEILG